MMSVQRANATATDAYQLWRRIRLEPGGDTTFPASVTFPLDYDRRLGFTGIVLGRTTEGFGPRWGSIEPLAGLEGSLIARFASGLPYTRTNETGDTLIGLPNSHRLPSQLSFDMLARRPFRIAGFAGSVYADVRNVLNRRNVIAVRRDSGMPAQSQAGIDAAAQNAFNRHPEPIPYESPRYRAFADADGNGVIENAELLELYRQAAADFFQPLFFFGPPRLIRLGAEITF
jgi:hypothetical protein